MAQIRVTQVVTADDEAEYTVFKERSTAVDASVFPGTVTCDDQARTVTLDVTYSQAT